MNETSKESQSDQTPNKQGVGSPTLGYVGKAYHRQEAIRIESELNNLGPEFAPDGIIRTVLRKRIEQERQRAT